MLLDVLENVRKEVCPSEIQVILFSADSSDILYIKKTGYCLNLLELVSAMSEEYLHATKINQTGNHHVPGSRPACPARPASTRTGSEM